MTRSLSTFLFALTSALLLGACASRGEVHTVYDLGPLPAAATAAAAPAMPALVVIDAGGPQPLDTQAMTYRLLYADPLQARAYANNRWSTTPLQMITLRFKSRIAQSGIKVLGVTDAAGGVPLLRMEVDDFSQHFDSPVQNYGQVTLRASLFNGHKLVDQKTFTRKAMAASADAAGGTRALASATDGVAEDILAWLASLPR